MQVGQMSSEISHKRNEIQEGIILHLVRKLIAVDHAMETLTTPQMDFVHEDLLKFCLATPNAVIIAAMVVNGGNVALGIVIFWVSQHLSKAAYTFYAGKILFARELEEMCVHLENSEQSSPWMEVCRQAASRLDQLS